MCTRRQANTVRRSLLSLAVCGSLMLLVLPRAHAADRPCPDGDINTNQGIEDNEGTTGENTTCHPLASAYGWMNIAGGNLSSAFGYMNTASGGQSSAFGYMNTANGDWGSAFGNSNTASGELSSAFGLLNTASNQRSSAFGHQNTASGKFSSAFGFLNAARSDNSSAFGYQSQALANNSTALGYQAVASVAGAVSFGHSATDLDVFGMAYGSDLNARLIHVAAGIDATDAVNLGQMNAAIAGIDSYAGWNLSAGGGAAQLIGDGDTVDFEADDPNGNLTVSRTGNTITYGFNSLNAVFGGAGGSFTIVNNTVVNMGGNVVGGVANGVAATDAANIGQLNVVAGDAAAAQASADAAQNSADNAQATADDAMTAANNAQATADTALTAANNAQASADHAQDTADHAQQSADAAQATADTALTTANNAVGIANTYTDTREAAIRSDMSAGDAATLASANAYTDQRFAAWNDTFSQYQQQVDARFAQTDARIDRVGAMGSAMTNMSASMAGIQTRNRLGVGVGVQNGRGAVAIGYQRAISSHATVTIGGAFSGNDNSVGVGAGFGW